MSERKVAIVVGGASGIGLATVAALAREGAAVVLADVNESAARDRAAEFGAAVTAANVDVTDEGTVARLFTDTVAEHGRIDTVVNCAGLTLPGAIADLELAAWQTTIDVCQTGTFLVLKHAARHVSDGASVVCIASLNGRQPAAGMAAYCAAKAAVLMLTEVAAMELASRKIRVNAISPGLVDTPLVAGLSVVPGLLDEYIENTPLGRSGTAEEIAEMVVFLASDKAGWMTGAAIDLNGGAHTRRYPDVLGKIAALAQ
ncbi:SDR family oxidoreductase [Aldersonia sp. NBC_00410]|uniref:SDR family NAD(P)-dependent oxidoreductase n=1 Tax=Aldersonia sp. NBC_00410 TaxID=2975954 RepID=UPI002258AB6C|nr:SDR family NAD(P)-dependent oxidoreductase [Aldersonia sp. NBC_00410]MCX5044770.1 SDR family oxidoreductase [Aldersonia sp. NBC_00410]